jgi:hypothetical protein
MDRALRWELEIYLAVARCPRTRRKGVGAAIKLHQALKLAENIAKKGSAIYHFSGEGI